MEHCVHTVRYTTMSFPDEPFFRRLVEFANGPPRIIIRDEISGFRITYRELLSGVLRFRKLLQQRLPPSAFDSSQMLREPIYIGILAPASVEFTVAFLAILALGGIVTPLCISPGIAVLPCDASPS